FTIVGIGLTRSVFWLTGRLWWLGLIVMALVGAALWFPPYDVGIDAFARNLTYDLPQIADSPAQHNLVLQYHSMAQFYADNELINPGHGSKTFDIRWEGEQSPAPLTQPVDPVIRGANLAAGDMVWCVIPAEVGESALRDCRITDPSNLELVTDSQGLDA